MERVSRKTTPSRGVARHLAPEDGGLPLIRISRPLGQKSAREASPCA